MSWISAYLNSWQKDGLPSDILANLKNDNAQCMTITIQGGKPVGNDIPHNDVASSIKGNDVVFKSDKLDDELNNEGSYEVVK